MKHKSSSQARRNAIRKRIRSADLKLLMGCSLDLSDTLCLRFLGTANRRLINNELKRRGALVDVTQCR